ncbi:hypothetical protein [Oryzifoliimicrobium ureilyticus]|uniref:hypothetical protein n=1 Tax=Oryzifoliimicrobium ureilyticus TaxID=3113724 RepID=UPI003F66A959
MCATGKAVFAYTNVARDHRGRVSDLYSGAVAYDGEGRLRDPNGIAVEDFGLADNLMLHAGIERRGGVLVVGDAAPEALYTDLAAFKTCLAIAVEKLR